MYFAIAAAVMQAVMQMQQARQAQAAQRAQIQQQEQQNQLMWQQQDQQVRQKRDLLNRQLAANRAALAAGGIGFAGSGAALMGGLARQAQAGIADDYANATLASQVRASGKSGSSSDGLMQGLQLAQQGLSVIRPMFSGP